MFGLNKKRIYLDYAAATPVSREVLKSMEPYWSDDFANPGSIHQEGERAKKALFETRKKIADCLNARTDEIFFTSGGTESNNLAVEGLFSKLSQEDKDLSKYHAIVFEAEHPSVLVPIEHLKRKGLEVSYIKMLPGGEIDIKSLKEELRLNTVFVSVMLVNNEIGKIYPIKEISKILNQYSKKNNIKKPILHTDASQAFLYLPLNLEKLSVDLLSLDSSKIYGPKGVGVLFKRRGLSLAPIILGGGQENGLRAGTVNLPAIVGFGEAISLSNKLRDGEVERLTDLRDGFLDKLLKKFPEIKLNGSLNDRIAGNINIFIPNLESEFAVIKLDEMGFAVSSASACLLEKGEVSYVLDLITRDGAISGSSIRISLGRETTSQDLDRLTKAIPALLKSRLS